MVPVTLQESNVINCSLAALTHWNPKQTLKIILKRVFTEEEVDTHDYVHKTEEEISE